MELQQYIDLYNDPDATLQKMYSELIREFYEVRTHVVLHESQDSDASKSIQDLEKQLSAAKRGLGLSNKLSGDAKTKHAKRVMGNLNKIRAQIARLKKQMKMH